MKWSILLASPAGGAVSDREKGVRRGASRTNDQREWSTRPVVWPPHSMRSVGNATGRGLCPFDAPRPRRGVHGSDLRFRFGSADPPGDLLVDPFRGHLSDYLLITIFFLR